MRNALVLISTGLVLAATPAAGQPPSQVQISGQVYFADNGEPAAGARVSLFRLSDLRQSVAASADAAGRFTVLASVDGSGAAMVPRAFSLQQNYPNPFNPGTVIPYQLHQGGQVRLEVFNLLGQRVRLLVDSAQPAGSHAAAWDATDDAGQHLGAGIYLYRLSVDGLTDSRQMALVDGPAGTATMASGRAAGPVPTPTNATAMAAGASELYGLTISGPGISTFVQPELLVDASTGQLAFVVERAGTGPAARATQATTRILGDVNNDGRVNISDALIVATYGLDHGITIPNSGDIALGDVNGDGRVNISDALIIATFGMNPTAPNLPAGIGQPVGVAISPDAVRVGSGGSPLTYRSTSGSQLSFAVQGTATPVQVGQVLVNTTEPYFLKKVTRVVRQTTSEVVVETTPAALTDVVREASIQESFSIAGASPKALSPARIQEFSLDLSGTVIAAEGGLSLQVTSGHVRYNPVYDFALEIDGGQVELFRLVAGGDLDAALGLRLTANGVFSGAREKTMAEIPAAPYHVVFWAGWVPVVVGIQMEISVGARVGVEAAGTAVAQFTLTHPARIGMEYANGRWQEVQVGIPVFAVGQPQLQMTAGAALCGYVDVQLNADLYDVAGPHVGLEPYAELAATLPATRDRLDWELVGGLVAYLGAHIEVFDDTIASYSKEFNWYKHTFLQGTIPLANQLPTATITAPASGTAYTQGTTVTLRGSATDPEDGTLSGGSLVWTSSRDGRLGTGGSLSTSSLSVGTHTITLTATDSRGGMGTATVTVTINPVTRRPDLLVDNLTVAPSPATTVTPLIVTVRVANAGQANAAQPRVVLRVDGVGRDSLAQDIGAGLEAWIEFDPLLLGVGAHTVEVVADPGGLIDDANRANNRTSLNITISPGAVAAQSVVFILDLSGSMTAVTSTGAPRLQVTKEALAQVLRSAPANGTREYALVTLGGSCTVATPVPFTSDPQAVASYAQGLVADGSTPLAEALRTAQHLALDQASSGDVQLVLLSDGKQEGCPGNPIEVAQAIAAGRRAKLAGATKPLARMIKLNVIGMGVAAGSAEEQQLQQIQQAAGGNYYRVTQPQDLASALGQASGLQSVSATLTGKVTDTQGRAISGASVRLLNHPDLREQTDANGTYRFPATFQGVDSLIVEATGYLRRATEVYVSGRSYDVQLQPSAALLPVAVATAEPASVNPGERVTLRGGGSSDPAGGILVYHWGQAATNPFPVGFSVNDSRDAFATRVTLDDPGTYLFILVVENPQGLRSAPDTVAVAVRYPPRTVTTPGGTTHQLVGVPAGEFQMGSTSGFSDERPVHTVYLDGYYIDQHEVTNAQYQAFVQATGRAQPYHASDSYYNQAQQPVVGVTWHDATAYCQWAGLRLPTEAEWEKAARGTDGRTYPWGEGIDASRANYNPAGPGKPSAVGSYPLGISPYGAHDLAGNVWEWVQDRYGSYPSGRVSNPTGPSSGSYRVLRGGSWYDFENDLRSAKRGWSDPSGRFNYAGFRCAQD